MKVSGFPSRLLPVMRLNSSQQAIIEGWRQRRRVEPGGKDVDARVVHVLQAVYQGTAPYRGFALMPLTFGWARSRRTGISKAISITSPAAQRRLSPANEAWRGS